jgi:hypothetical protein
MKVFELYHREGRFCFPMQLVDLAILHVEAKNIRNEHIFYVQYYNRSVHHGLALFAWLISHQPTVLFSQNKPATSNQNQPAVLFSQNKPAPAISHQPTEQAEIYVAFISWLLRDN